MTKTPLWVVVDTETTGFGNVDRIVEIAAVVIDPKTRKVVDEYDTLINPLRDVGPTHVHGITASMVSSAPTFLEASVGLSHFLNGNILVAHNLKFDERFISNEYRRIDVNFQPGRGICTLSLSGQKLADACSKFNIDLSNHHRALADARASAELLLLLLDERNDSRAMEVSGLTEDWSPRTLRRDSVQLENSMSLRRAKRRVVYPSSDLAVLSYLDVLDSYLDDLVLSEIEKRNLVELADELDLHESQIPEIHWMYVESLISAAQRDGVVTENEYALLLAIATALDVPNEDLPARDLTVNDVDFAPGTRVCFTGEAFVNSAPVTRAKLESIAAKNGLQPVSSVTKKACDLVVAADPSTQSGKASSARSWGIPVIGVVEFLTRLSLNQE